MKKNLHERFFKAVDLERSGDFVAALTEYVSIIREDKNFREAYLNLGSLYSRMNRLEKAMKCYALALKLKKDYLTYFNVGSIY
jgi:tetratricopeptide (TPR) repeat protein